MASDNNLGGSNVGGVDEIRLIRERRCLRRLARENGQDAHDGNNDGPRTTGTGNTNHDTEDNQSPEDDQTPDDEQTTDDEQTAEDNQATANSWIRDHDPAAGRNSTTGDSAEADHR